MDVSHASVSSHSDSVNAGSDKIVLDSLWGFSKHAIVSVDDFSCSADVTSTGIPFWEVFDTAASLVSQYPDWVVQVAHVSLIDSSKFIASDLLVSQLVDSHGSHGFMKKVAVQVSTMFTRSDYDDSLGQSLNVSNAVPSSSADALSSFPCLGYHLANGQNPVGLAAWFMFLVPSDKVHIFDRIHSIFNKTPVSGMFGVNVMIPTQAKLVTVSDCLHVNDALVSPESSLASFYALDGSSSHQWLHTIMTLVAPLDGVGRLDLGFHVACLSIDPCCASELLFDGKVFSYKSPFLNVFKQTLPVVSKDLSSAANEFRFVAGSLFETVPFDGLREAVFAVLNVPVVYDRLGILVVDNVVCEHFSR